jgi:tetratricopeptide (TPR) repeat protein
MPYLLRACKLLMVAVLVVPIMGCPPQKRTASPIDLYNSGQYPAALAAAREQADKAEGPERQRNRFIAGMSAYQMKSDDEALRYLTAVAGDDTATSAGEAAATAGLIYERNQKFTQAQTYFELAAKKLTGENQAQALLHLGNVQQKLGAFQAARSNIEKAVNNSQNPAFKEAARARMSVSGYAVQVGSYGDKNNADKQAAAMAAKAKNLGYAAPRIVPSGRLYAVQVGNFLTWDAAVKAKSLLGKDAVVVELKS